MLGCRAITLPSTEQIVVGFNFLSKEGVFVFNGPCIYCTYFALGAWFDDDVC